MKTPRLLWLFLVCIALLWISPQLRRLSPFFGDAILQNSCGAVLALLLSIGIFLSLKQVFDRTTPARFGLLLFVLFVTVYTTRVATFVTGAAMLPQYREFLSNTASESFLTTLVKRLCNTTDPNAQQKVAMLIYQQHGITVPFRTEEGHFAYYQPTNKDLESWSQSKTTIESAKETLNIYDSLIPQFHRLITIYLVALLSVFLVGSIAVTVKKNKNTSITTKKIDLPLTKH